MAQEDLHEDGEYAGPDSNWEGPGIYRHYKGGIYVAIGLIRLEWNEGKAVAYMTTDPEHRKDHFHQGFMATARPLDPMDGPDAWNTSVYWQGEKTRRFKKIA